MCNPVTRQKWTCSEAEGVPRSVVAVLRLQGKSAQAALDHVAEMLDYRLNRCPTALPKSRVSTMRKWMPQFSATSKASRTLYVPTCIDLSQVRGTLVEGGRKGETDGQVDGVARSTVSEILTSILKDKSDLAGLSDIKIL